MMKELYYEEYAISEIYIADTFIKRFFGYMFQKEPRCNAILIEPCNSIHTFFMQFDIDVFFVNDEMKIIKKVSKLQRGQVIMPVKGAKMVIEAKAGALNNIQEGSIVKISNLRNDD